MATATQNREIVLEAFDTLFNRHDLDGARQYWSGDYIQHSAHIAPGLDGLLELVASLPATLRYENQVCVAEGDYVMLYGRFTGNGNVAATIAADVVRLDGGRLVEHWDVLQDEPTQAESRSGRPMFGVDFPDNI